MKLEDVIHLLTKMDFVEVSKYHFKRDSFHIILTREGVLFYVPFNIDEIMYNYEKIVDEFKKRGFEVSKGKENYNFDKWLYLQGITVAEAERWLRMSISSAKSALDAVRPLLRDKDKKRLDAQIL
ncbi:MAG: hypothetical protein ACE5K4_08850 [Candidatus Hydrothermarchaeota archaeon]